MVFCRQVYRRGLPCPPPRHLTTQRSNLNLCIGGIWKEVMRMELMRTELSLMGSDLLQKKSRGLPHHFLLCDDRVRRQKTIYEPGSRPSPDTESADILILDFSAPELWEINLLFVSHPVYGILLQPNRLRQKVKGQDVNYLLSTGSDKNSISWWMDGQIDK